MVELLVNALLNRINSHYYFLTIQQGSGSEFRRGEMEKMVFSKIPGTDAPYL